MSSEKHGKPPKNHFVREVRSSGLCVANSGFSRNLNQS